MVGVNGYRALRAWVITPHAQHERGTVMGVGAHIYVCGPKKYFELYISDRLTFSNILGRTSCIYRLALLLRAPETLSSSSKSRVFLI